MAARDEPSLEEALLRHAQVCLDRSGGGGDAWEQQARRIIERDELLLSAEQLRDGAWCMEFAPLIKRARAAGRFAVE
jgi:hypothetical protein